MGNRIVLPLRWGCYLVCSARMLVRLSHYLVTLCAYNRHPCTRILGLRLSKQHKKLSTKSDRKFSTYRQTALEFGRLTMDNDFVWATEYLQTEKRVSLIFILSLRIILTANRNSVFHPFPALEEDDRIHPWIYSLRARCRQLPGCEPLRLRHLCPL